MLKRIYFDANAGMPLLADVRAAVVAALDEPGNPSSVHAEGRRSRAAIESARAAVAGAVGAKTENVIFTSGATEAAALALTPDIHVGNALRPAGRLYIGATEHPCVLAGGRFAPEQVTTLPVRRDGRIDLQALDETLAAHRSDQDAPYLTLMLANNETGVLHPVADAAAIVKRHGGYVFCDAVQALGRIPLDINALGVDFLALSAHKLGGPQGVGALVLADETVRPRPLLRGGGQERRQRAGTENMSGIVGFSVAAQYAGHHLADMAGIAAIRDEAERTILAIAPETKIIGGEAERLPNTTMFAVTGLSAETLVAAFDLEGIAVSAGSACSSGKVAASHVLEAMGEPADVARSGIRVSLTPDASVADVEAFGVAWRAIYARMRQSRAA